MSDLLPNTVGALIRDARREKGLTQTQLADLLNTSQSAIGRIEAGGQNLSIEMINRIGAVLESPLLLPAKTTQPASEKKGVSSLRISGPTKLSGAIGVCPSKNASVALLCASLMNHGRTVLKNIAQIEEVNRIIEVLTSIGVQVTWLENRNKLELIRPEKLDLAAMDTQAAGRTRSIIMLLGPLLHDEKEFRLPFSGGCDLGKRTIHPHKSALAKLGIFVETSASQHHITLEPVAAKKRRITLIERGDTVTENVLMAAALSPGTTIINNASANYMVQDLCFFLKALGVQINGIGSTQLIVEGSRNRIEKDVEFSPSEDPIEAMSFMTAGIVTGSQLTIERAPIEFLEVELAILEDMGLEFQLSNSRKAENNHTDLLDITIYPSELNAARDKIHPMPFPGLNIDNLPFFSVIAAAAKGQTLIHDWVYENRAMHLVTLEKLGVNLQFIDAHRLSIHGPARFKPADIRCPSALRPAVCLLLATLAANGTSTIHDIYMINRGYADIPRRLNELGADIENFEE